MNQTLRQGDPETGRVLSKAAARHEMWRRRRGVIDHVREMPAWEDGDDVDVKTLGHAYNELRQKALHLARIVEKEMELHQQRIDSWKKKGGRGA